MRFLVTFLGLGFGLSGFAMGVFTIIVLQIKDIKKTATPIGMTVAKIVLLSLSCQRTFIVCASEPFVNAYLLSHLAWDTNEYDDHIGYNHQRIYSVWKQLEIVLTLFA
jgi:hypothetical protein